MSLGRRYFLFYIYYIFIFSLLIISYNNNNRYYHDYNNNYIIFFSFILISLSHTIEFLPSLLKINIQGLKQKDCIENRIRSF